MNVTHKITVSFLFFCFWLGTSYSENPAVKKPKNTGFFSSVFNKAKEGYDSVKREVSQIISLTQAGPAAAGMDISDPETVKNINRYESEKDNTQKDFGVRSVKKVGDQVAKLLVMLMGIKTDGSSKFSEMIPLFQFPMKAEQKMLSYAATIESSANDLQKYDAVQKFEKLFGGLVLERKMFVDVHPHMEVRGKKWETYSEAEKKALVEEILPANMLHIAKSDSLSVEVIKHLSHDQVQALPLEWFGSKIGFRKNVSAFEKYVGKHAYRNIPYLNFTAENQQYLTHEQIKRIGEQDGLGLEILHVLIEERDNKTFAKEYGLPFDMESVSQSGKSRYSPEYDFVARLSNDQKIVWLSSLEKSCKFLVEARVNPLQAKEEYAIKNIWTWTEEPLVLKTWDLLPVYIRKLVMMIISKKFPVLKTEIERNPTVPQNTALEDREEVLVQVYAALLQESMGTAAYGKSLKEIISLFKFPSKSNDLMQQYIKSSDFDELEKLVAEQLDERNAVMYARPETVVRGKKWSDYANFEQRKLINEIVPKEAFKIASKGKTKKISPEVVAFLSLT